MRRDSLDLEIALGYVAQFGTLMVDGLVIPDVEGLASTPLRCAVHFVSDGDDFRYRVLAAEKTLDPFEGDATLRDRADDERWAHSRTTEYTTPIGAQGEAEALSVHLGQWPEEFHREEARLAARMHVEKDLLIDEALREVGLHPGKNADAVRVANYQRAKAVLRNVAPTSMLPVPEGLGAILESGQFTVNGSVYFSPLQPLQPAPEILSTDAQGNTVGDTEDRFYAIEPISGEQGYRYPEDARSGSHRGGGSQ